MTCKRRLSVPRIRALKPKNHRFTVSDGAGLGLEVQPSGVMSWRVRYRLRGKPAKINLGRWPSMSLDQARKARDEIQAALRDGLNPAAERRQKTHGVTVREFGERYLREVVAEDRKNPAAVRRYLERDIYPVLGDVPLAAVRAEDLRQLIFARRNAGRGQAAVALRGVMKRLWDYALVCEVAQINPTAATPNKYIAKARSRKRALNEKEIGLFLRRLDAARLRPMLKIAFRLILLTMVRKSELLLARWEHVNLETGEWEIPPEHSKNGEGAIVYLSRQARELLQGLQPVENRVGCLFPRPGMLQPPLSASTLNRALKRIEGGMDHFTVHDQRRTGATRLAEMGYNSDWIEKALNHSIKGVRGVYNRAEYAEHRRKMLQEWADRLDELKAGQ
jgi:integrase